MQISLLLEIFLTRKHLNDMRMKINTPLNNISPMLNSFLPRMCSPFRITYQFFATALVLLNANISKLSIPIRSYYKPINELEGKNEAQIFVNEFPMNTKSGN